ncbi:hypothetical protein BpHYR1_004740 [Brachionus plicatilis]|uniref:Uncharacterized protein n=1 Tax=Brachionus plicatilis TaxID=10195 RepID=A0A3M7PN19_BRAPC|nr:hypothetical protein BpHYR1_004740 [Brachionus plicatilis]
MKLDTSQNESATSSANSDSEFASGSKKSSIIELKMGVNRKSYYDNHLKEDTSDTNSSESENNLISDSSGKIEKDDFEDLIDLTHRVPRKLMKKNSPSASRKKAPKPSSLPPLPPLPYSFVKIERSKGDSSLYLNKKEESKESTGCRKAITRLIMPVQKCSANTKNIDPDRMKSNEVVQEWDQISKIFASLETLLNDVVQTNSTTSFDTRSNAEIENFQRGKSSHNHRTMSEHNLKNTDSQMNSLSFNSVNRSNSKSKYVKKLLGSPTSTDESVQANSFHLNMKKFKYFELSEYLTKIKMSKYEFKFLTNGYDDLAFLVI